MQLHIDAVYEKLRPTVIPPAEQQQQQGGAARPGRKRRRTIYVEQTELDEQAEQARRPTISYWTRLQPITSIRDVGKIVDAMIKDLRNRHENAMQNVSNLVIREIKLAELLVAKYVPLAGSRYAELPAFLAKKKAILNVRNTDNRCFGYAVLSALLQMDRKEHAARPEKYDAKFEELGLDKLNYPVRLEDLEAVERQIDIAFNVYSFYDDEGKGRYCAYSSRIEVDNAIDLLFWEEHFAWIKDFSRFMGDITKHQHALHWCKRCLCHFQRTSAYAKHQLCCRGTDGCKPMFKMPPEGSTIQFKNVKYEERTPFVIYSDFECLTVPIEVPAEQQQPQPAVDSDTKSKDDE